MLAMVNGTFDFSGANMTTDFAGGGGGRRLATARRAWDDLRVRAMKESEDVVSQAQKRASRMQEQMEKALELRQEAAARVKQESESFAGRVKAAAWNAIKPYEKPPARPAAAFEVVPLI